jgi:GntR family transcriptional regulator/MocR family aminotransferase
MSRRTDPLLTLPDKRGVLYVRLYQRMRALILQGAWPVGMRLPSSRRLAEDLGISRNTASLALDQLLADGWIETRNRAGTYVSTESPALVRPPQTADDGRQRVDARPPVPFEMAHGAIDAFPFDRWSKLQSKIWSNFVPDLLYDGDPAGDPGLRQAIATMVAPVRGLSVTVNDIVIVGSTRSGFDLIAAALPANSAVIVEDPGYHFADGAFHRRGFKVIPAVVDDDGLDVAAARAACPSPGLIVVGSASQFPLGVPMSSERRRQLLDWARDCGAWIIDDSFDADARFDGAAPAPSLQAEDRSGRVITICSLSRMLFRSLRLAFITVPAELRGAVLEAQAANDGFEPLPNQLVLREFIDRGLWSAHQRKCRELHRDRREALVVALTPYLGTLFDRRFNPCGLHLLLRPLRHPADEIADALRSAGIACTTLAQITRGIPGDDGVLLGFAAFSPDVVEASRPALDAALQPFR